MSKKKEMTIINSFPKKLMNEVEIVVREINFKFLKSEISEEKFEIMFKNNEIISIPYRIYFDEIDGDSYNNFSLVQKAILCCVYTRHHNGHIREKYLSKLMNLNIYEEWIIPFVTRLTGEYVIELLYISDKILDKFSQELISDFNKNNLAFVKCLKSQIISYWNEYYRKEYSNLLDEKYIGFKIYKTYFE